MRFIRHQNNGILKTLHGIKDETVEVGVFPDASYPDGTPVAAVAYKHEFGAKNEDIPMRSFFRTTIHEKENDWVAKAEAMILKGDDALDVMNTMGAVIAGDIKEKIVKISTPPNSAKTIKRKGFNDPLIDTRTMLKSVTHKMKVDV